MLVSKTQGTTTAGKPVPAPKAVDATPVTRASDNLKLSTTKPVQAQANEKKEWTFGRVAKTAGVGVGAFAAANVGTFVVDLFFHFGNNGGTAFAGPIYLAIAGAAALGAMYLSSRK